MGGEKKMKELFHILPAFSSDYAGVYSVLTQMGGLIVTYDVLDIF